MRRHFIRLLVITMIIGLGGYSLTQYFRYPTRLRYSFHFDRFGLLQFSEDGKQLLTSQGNIVELRDLATGHVDTAIKTSSGVSEFAKFSPDSRLVAIMDDAKNLNVWGKDGTKIKSFSWEEYSEEMISFSPDSSLFAVEVMPNRQCGLFDSATGKEIARFETQLRNLAMSPDGQTVFVAAGLWANVDERGTIWSWDVKTQRQGAAQRAHEAAINGLTLSRDGKSLASVTLPAEGKKNAEIKIWDAATMQERGRITQGVPEIGHFFFSPDGGMLVAGHAPLSVWAMRSLPPRYFGNFFVIPEFSADGSVMTIMDPQRQIVQCWDTRTLQRKNVFDGAALASFIPDTSQLSPDARWLVLYGRRNTLDVPDVVQAVLAKLGLRLDHEVDAQIWNTETHKLWATFHNDIFFSSDNRSLVTIHEDGTIRVWDWPPRRPWIYVLGLAVSGLLLTLGVVTWCSGRRFIAIPKLLRRSGAAPH